MSRQVCPRCKQPALKRFASPMSGSLVCQACGEELRFRYGQRVMLALFFFIVVLLPILLALNASYARLGLFSRILFQWAIGLPILALGAFVSGRLLPIEKRRRGAP